MTKFSIPQYNLKIDKQIKQLRKSRSTSTRAAANNTKVVAKRLAPKGRTHETIKGIRTRKQAKGWKVESWVPGSFKQNLFANRTGKYARLTYKKSNKRYGIKAGDTVIYGKLPTHWTWTGTPMFFDIAIQDTKKKFPRIVRNHTTKALRGLL